MLAVTTYPSEYIENCRKHMEEQLAAFERLVHASRAPAAVAGFELLFFGNLVLVLDACFAHRLRSREGKDGNALNEVRLLCRALLHCDGVLTADSTIKYRPAASVLGLEIGGTVELNANQFRDLSRAFFAEIERKYSAPAKPGASRSVPKRRLVAQPAPKRKASLR